MTLTPPRRRIAQGPRGARETRLQIAWISNVLSNPALLWSRVGFISGETVTGRTECGPFLWLGASSSLHRVSGGRNSYTRDGPLPAIHSLTLFTWAAASWNNVAVFPIMAVSICLFQSTSDCHGHQNDGTVLPSISSALYGHPRHKKYSQNTHHSFLQGPIFPYSHLTICHSCS